MEYLLKKRTVITLALSSNYKNLVRAWEMEAEKSPDARVDLALYKEGEGAVGRV